MKLWNKDWAYVSDEVYGTATGDDHGCPWGWARMIDISDPTTPTVEAEYRLPENDPEAGALRGLQPAAHLLLGAQPDDHAEDGAHDLALGRLPGDQRPEAGEPYQLAEYFPEPLHEVMLEDPRLSSDPDTGRHEKVVMWSYPIIKDGLIYVVDLRNGLYVLKYGGRFANEVRNVSFLEGNSNQGNALCYEPVGTPPAFCDD